MKTFLRRLGFPRPHRRYIVPTRFGLAYGLVVFFVFLGAVNYDDNTALFLAFVLAALGWLVMVRCERNLRGLEIHIPEIRPGFVGRPMEVGVEVRSREQRPRVRLALGLRGTSAISFQRPAGGEVVLVRLSWTPERRGKVSLPPWRLSCERPLGLFHAWCSAPTKRVAVVAPAPDTEAPPRPPRRRPADPQIHGEEGDFRDLRAWKPGDSSHHVAWRIYAQRRELLVRHYEDPPPPITILDWTETEPLVSTGEAKGCERRLSILCRWVLEADREGTPYGLALPDVGVAPGTGVPHLDACLTALACHECP